MQWKLFTAGVAFCAVAGVGLGGEYLDSLRAEATAREEQHEDSLGKILPRTPSEVLRGLNNRLATRAEPDKACLLMDEPVRPVFAAAFGEKDCAAAMSKLSAKVTNGNNYIQFNYKYGVDQRMEGQDGYMDGCAITWGGGLFDPPNQPDPGPKLGRFTMRRMANQGFLITGFEPCPPPSSTSSTTAPPTTTTTTGGRLLPSYPPGYPAILAARIAKNDPGVCGLFSEAGAAQFAAAYGAADCAAAVAKLHGQVTNADQYGQPDIGGTKETPGANGRTVVDGCVLTWTVFGQGSVQPGPKIGRLQLARPQDNIGYEVVGYTPC